MEHCREEVWNLTKGNVNFDIDQIVVNLRMEQNLIAILRRFVGNSISIATSTHRKFHHEAGYDALVLLCNPAIITTLSLPGLKEAICNALRERGFVAVEADEDLEHLMQGQTKVVPVETFVGALMDAGIGFIRLMMFGMKQKMVDLPIITDNILDNNATDHGYPMNVWDIGSSTRCNYLYVIKVTCRDCLPNTTRIKPYVMFTPFDRRNNPHANHRGNFTLKMHNPNAESQIVKVKVYALLFHFLWASHEFKFYSPTSSRQGVKYIRDASEVFSRMEEYPGFLGGLRIETTITSTLLSQAWEIYQNERPDNLRQFFHPAVISVRAMSTFAYLVFGRQLIAKMKSKLVVNGVTNRHDAIRELTMEEKEWFGDIKSLLGYAHVGYKTDPILPTAWWKEKEVQLPVEEEPEEDLEEPIPETPDRDVNALLCQLCEQNRRQLEIIVLFGKG